MRIRSQETRTLLEERSAVVEDQSILAFGEPLLPPEDLRLSPLARAAYDPDDPVARIARSLRTSISAAAPQVGTSIRSVAIVNIDAAFEASVLAANLAISYAQTGAPTVLLDANPDGAEQHALLGVAPGEGLAAALAGNADMRTLLEPTAIRNLSVLPAGASSSDASVFLDAERFHRRAIPLLDSYAMMIVDVAVPFEDPPSLCEAIQAAVVVVRRNVSSIDAVQHILDRLKEMKTHIVGTLIVD
jgi:protein-tyrosine kinase